MCPAARDYVALKVAARDEAKADYAKKQESVRRAVGTTAFNAAVEAAMQAKNGLAAAEKEIQAAALAAAVICGQRQASPAGYPSASATP